MKNLVSQEIPGIDHESRDFPEAEFPGISHPGILGLQTLRGGAFVGLGVPYVLGVLWIALAAP